MLCCSPTTNTPTRPSCSRPRCPPPTSGRSAPPRTGSPSSSWNARTRTRRGATSGAPALNRRYLNDTAVRAHRAAGRLLAGPKTAADPAGRTIIGTLGNCSGGTTPWGTILSGEENFNGYFVAPGTSAEDKRYGLTNKPTARQWELDDPRFDTRNPASANEANRFGWIVEIDPFDPTSTPKKHSRWAGSSTRAPT